MKKNKYNSQRYRSQSAEETYEKIQPFWVDMGITRLANITGLDQIGIPVFIAVRPNSKSLSLFQGKGIYAIDAKVSALMEAIESYHGENIDAQVIEASASELGLGKVCDFLNLPTCRNAKLCDGTKMRWVEAVNVLTQDMQYVPYQMANVDLTMVNEEAPNFIQSSNGLASGNTEQEALNHAVCEIIERDAYSCWTLWRDEQRYVSKLDLKTVNSDHCEKLIQMFDQADCYVGVWDISSDLRIPTFLVRVIPKEKPPYCQIRPASGFGCHPNKESALIRALTEAAQSRLTFIAGARDDIRMAHYRSFTDESEYQRWHQSVVEHKGLKSYKSINSYPVCNQEEVWHQLKRNLLELGIEQVLAVDLSKKKFGIPVFKVMIPGLEGGESYQDMEPGIRAQKLIQNNNMDEGRLSA